MNRSDSIAELAGALASAQGEFLPVRKDRSAKIKSQKGDFSYSYADLADAIAATRAALSKHGLAVIQPVRAERGVIVVTTMLTHASGQWISEECSWPVADGDNRSIGSGVTYARRHAYLSILGAAATDEDDDGEKGRGGDHETAQAGPTQAQRDGIRRELTRLKIMEDRAAYIEAILPGASTVDDFAEILATLRARGAPPA